MKPNKLPNWLTDNDWSLASRIDWANQIMTFSSRDWSVYPFAVSGTHDIESWSLWCLICCHTKEEAIDSWIGFVNQYLQEGE